MPNARICTRIYHAPCGTLLLGSFGATLCLCDWTERKQHTTAKEQLQRRLGAPLQQAESPTLQQAAAELDAYFAGELHTFRTPLLLLGTAFRNRVWEQLRHIPYGSVLSYGEQARRLGMPGAARSVANADAANPLSLFVPCHRIIGSGGRLGGYGGGLAAKRYLLEREGVLPPRLLP